MESKLYSILLNTIIGDALGSPFSGLGKKHIKSLFKEIKGYTDPLPALKGKTERWKKPGLYSSISQLTLFFFMNSRKSNDGYSRLLKSLPESKDSDMRIFRYPDAVTENYLAGCFTGKIEPSYIPSAHILPLCLHLCTDEDAERTIRACRLAKSFTEDPYTAAGSAVFTEIIASGLSDDQPLSAQTFTDACRNAAEALSRQSPSLFDLGLNPDSVIAAAEKYKDALRIITESSEDTAVHGVIEILNEILKTPVTRLTVNHPLAIIPYALHLALQYRDRPEDALLFTASEGGDAAALCACTGAFTGIMHPSSEIPEQLISGLVNRKRILALAESIASGRSARSEYEEFINSELALTTKFHEELRARNKNKKDAPSAKRNKHPRETADEKLARHVVESWTKMDKARWKKERKKKTKG